MSDVVLAALISGGAVLLVAIAGFVGNWLGVRSTRKAAAETREAEREAREAENARRLHDRSEQAAGALLPLFHNMAQIIRTERAGETEPRHGSLMSLSSEAQRLILDIQDKKARDTLNTAIQCLYSWDDAQELGTPAWKTAGIIETAAMNILGAIRRAEEIPDTPDLAALSDTINEYYAMQQEMMEESRLAAARDRKAEAARLKEQISEQAPSSSSDENAKGKLIEP